MTSASNFMKWKTNVFARIVHEIIPVVVFTYESLRCCQGDDGGQLQNSENENPYPFINLRDPVLLELKTLFIIFIDKIFHIRMNIIHIHNIPCGL